MPLPPFKPLPFLGNAHVQTVLGAFFGNEAPRQPLQTTVVPLSDGDGIAAHMASPPAWASGAPQAVLVHGLGGCHASPYVVRVMNRLLGRGWRVVAVDMRGAGAGVAHASRIYNAACSDDIAAVVRHFQALAPDSPTCLVGFSLGGNIVLKLAAEAVTTGMALAAVVAIAPPVDLERCSRLIEKLPFYNRFFVRHLTDQVRKHEETHAHVPRTPFPRGLTLLEFDDLYTAPRGGYAGALDYYRRASSLPLIDAIQAPTLVLSARDDPFVCAQPLEKLAPRKNIETHIAAQGGHLGFLGFDGAGGVRWAERHVVEWLCERVSSLRLQAGVR